MVTDEETSEESEITRRDLGKGAIALLLIAGVGGSCVHLQSADRDRNASDDPSNEGTPNPPETDLHPTLEVRLDHPRPDLITTDTGTIRRMDIPLEGSVAYRHEDAARLQMTVCATVEEWTSEQSRMIDLSQRAGEIEINQLVDVLEGHGTDRFDNRKRGTFERTDVTLSVAFEILDTGGNTLLSVTVSFAVIVRVYREREDDDPPARGGAGGQGSFEIED